MQPGDLVHPNGTTPRGPYLVVGVIAFAIKYNLDRVIAEALYHKQWDFTRYFLPLGGLFSETPDAADLNFYLTMLGVALPFVWVGVVMTLRRLHDTGLPSWQVLLFFVPILNLIFIAMLCILPSRETVSPAAPRGAGLLYRIIPDNAWGSAALALFLIVPPAVCTAAVGAQVLRNYGWGLFIALPFAVGLASVLLYSYHGPRSYGSCLLVSCMAIVLVGVALLVVAVEGIMCIAMAAPIALVLSIMGGTVGYFVQHRYWSRTQFPTLVLMLLLSAPAVMGAETLEPLRPPLMSVTSTVDVEAPPEVVWRNVVSFAPLPPPTEWIFQTGVAYPMRAVIRGRGPGAVRYCAFSTGAFVEPIEVWDEPRLLRFSVRSQPAPMAEWSPYHDLAAAHLDNYLVSERGQFVLQPLPGHRTRLLGTTWYRHKIWPVSYWRVYSDAIIHRIHERVLQHIKRLSETSTAAL